MARRVSKMANQNEWRFLRQTESNMQRPLLGDTNRGLIAYEGFALLSWETLFVSRGNAATTKVCSEAWWSTGAVLLWQAPSWYVKT